MNSKEHARLRSEVERLEAELNAAKLIAHKRYQILEAHGLLNTSCVGCEISLPIVDGFHVSRNGSGIKLRCGNG